MMRQRRAIALAAITVAVLAGIIAALVIWHGEQQRFDEGRRIYEAMCQACHQADGRGQSGRAASLIGSPLALAS